MNTAPNLIVDLTIEFALEIIEFTELLQEKKKYNTSNQLFRSGTSIGSNVHEAQSCESRVDFIHKMKIAAKEAEESRYWLILCQKSKRYPDTTILLENLQSIIKVLNKIIVSSNKTTKT